MSKQAAVVAAIVAGVIMGSPGATAEESEVQLNRTLGDRWFVRISGGITELRQTSLTVNASLVFQEAA